MKEEIIDILMKHTGTINSFIDKKGHNHFKDTVNELETVFKNKLWEIGADIMKQAGVKNIKTTYFKK